MSSATSPTRRELLARAFREFDPEKAARQAEEAKQIVAALNGAESRMRPLDRRYLVSLRQAVARPDLMERISESRLIWMRKLVAEYLEVSNGNHNL